MGVPKRMAVAVSGLVFAGGAALAVGAATPASAQAVVAAPQQLVTGGGCGCGRGRSSNRFHHRNHFRTNQRVIVVNRNNNFSRSESDQFQRNQQRRVPVVPNQMNVEEDEDD